MSQTETERVGVDDAARALANAYADRHERLDNFIVMYAVSKRLLGRFGIDLLSGRGYALLFSGLFLGILVPAVLLAIVESTWTELPLLVAVAGSLAMLNVVALLLAQASAFKISGLHRALAEGEQIRSLMRWDRRWYSPAASAVMGGSIAAVYLVILYVLTMQVTGVSLSATTLWICTVVMVFLGQFSFSTAMIFFEFRAFRSCRFTLSALSPIDTRALQLTSAGLKELGIVSIVLLPLFYFVLLTVLPAGSSLNVPLMAGFLALAYLATAVGILFPLAFLGTIVKHEKWRQLEPIQTRLNQLAPRVVTLDGAELEELSRLQSIQRAIADSSDSLLGFAALARIAGTVALSTLTVVATALVQSYPQGLF